MALLPAATQSRAAAQYNDTHGTRTRRTLGTLSRHEQPETLRRRPAARPRRAELATAVASLHALPGAVDLRWTAVEGWHFTLAFLGNVDEELLPEL